MKVLVLLLSLMCSGCVVENGDYKDTRFCGPIYHSVRDGCGGWHEIEICHVTVYKNYP